MINYKSLEKEEFYATLKVWKDLALNKEERNFLGEMRISILYNCSIKAILNEKGEVESILSYTITQGYLNIYFIYTIPNLRGKGYSRKLISHVLMKEKGINRIYSIASTKKSANMYQRFGFNFWGVNAKGHLVTDTAWSNDAEFKYPRKAYKVLKMDSVLKPMSDFEIKQKAKDLE